MNRIIRVFYIVILFTHICLEVTLATQRLESPVVDTIVKEEYEPRVPSILFSPRLGRKKRTTEDDITKMEEKLIETIKKEPYVKILVGNEKLICSRLNDNRYDFTPRPGRNVEEEALGNEKWSEYDSSPEYVFQRSPPFAPRLGKRYYFIPRLGREI